MRVVTLAESKALMLDILNDVSDFCDSRNLVYYLAYGTLIGAIRHKGFIPWDDDIDIMMPRPDYERFLKEYHCHGKYAISSPLIDKGSFLIYTKVFDSRTVKYERGVDYNRFPPLGVDIDVFPLDGIPDDDKIVFYKRDSLRQVRLGRLLARSITSDINTLTLKSLLASIIINPICRLIGKDFFIRESIRLAMKYPFENCNKVHVAFPNSSSMKEQYDKLLFSERVKVEFESFMYWAPKGYEKVLRSYYGDYMQLPPLEKQQTHHNNYIYWKD